MCTCTVLSDPEEGASFPGARITGNVSLLISQAQGLRLNHFAKLLWPFEVTYLDSEDEDAKIFGGLLICLPYTARNFS